MTVIIYGTQVCPKCDRLKKYFETAGVTYEKKDLEDPAVFTPELATELTMAGFVVSRLDAPILFAKGRYLSPKKLFNGTEINFAVVNSALGLN